jgi:ABC-type transport system involved in multi-copper enzyme maturation permease subunit
MHRGSTLVLSSLILLVGIAILVSTIARDGLGFTYGIVLGVLFVLAGALRLWAWRKGA